MKKVLVICGLLFSLSGWGQTLPYQNPELSPAERAKDLVKRLTLEEKALLMCDDSEAIPRLGIKKFNWWSEALHGVANQGNVTVFPEPVGMAASFNDKLVFEIFNAVSDEMRAKHNERVRNGLEDVRFHSLSVWTPNVNIFRDPRWGRGQETYGEDPYLTSQMGIAVVKGLQGPENEKYRKLLACAKHYAVHSGPEWNRHTYDAKVNNHDLWDTYLPAFKELVVEGKVTGVMCAYNSFFGQPCCGNDLLMMDILRNHWKFGGYVTSDCGAVEDFYNTHKTHQDAAAASADAVLHGTDCECGNGAYRALADAVLRGLITEKQIDESLKKLFEIRFRLGMFDPDDRVPYSNIPLSVLECDAHKAHALKMARQSIVLLKNQDQLLPLNKNKIKKIAVVGPNADDKSVLLANYYGYPSHITTALEGIQKKVGNQVEVVYEKGVNLTDDFVFTSAYEDALFCYDGQQGFKADYYQNTQWQGNPGLSRLEKTVDYQWGDGQDVGDGIITRQMSAVWSTVFTPKQTGEVCFELKADDKAELYIDGVKQNKVGNINSYYLLNAEKGKSYPIEIRYVQHADNAEIKFDMGILRKADYKQTAAAVKDADVIIFVGGLSAKVEGEEMGVEIEGFKRGDRTSISIPSVQQNLLKELYATGKPVVFVMMTGSALGLEWESAHLPAILNAWYGGQAGGQAIADVLFGDYNPSGRLPLTFYKSVNDLPDFEDYSMENRTYRYFTGTPVYPFGYGLSYTTFQYSSLKLQPSPDKRSVKVTAKITNTGKMEGEEVAQLYVSNPRDFVTPIRALKGFKRINLKPGESQTVEFVLTSKELSVVDISGKSVPMKGKVQISLGGGQPSTQMIKSKSCVQGDIL